MLAGRIAVVDDDATFLALMRELLETEGYEVAACQSAAQAALLVRAIRPDLVILDLIMEQLDSGWQTLSGLRRDPATAAILVLVCSADAVSLREQAPRLRAQGCDTLEEPFDLDDLLAKVRRNALSIAS